MDYKEFWKLQRCFCCVKDEIEQVMAPFATASGVTGGQLRILTVLGHSDDQTVSALARSLCMADANMSTQIKRLCEKGLVTRRRHEDDERLVLVSLTAEGSRLALAFAEHCNRRLQGAMDLASGPEREAIRQGLLALEQVVRRNAAARRQAKTAAEPLGEKSLHVRAYKENIE